MSSPIAIPRRSSPARSAAADSPVGSPTGLYVPVHKRSASSSPSTSTIRSNSPPRSPRAAVHQPLTIMPMGAKVPFVYDMIELLALSASPLVGLSPSQREHLAQLLPLTAPNSAASPKEMTPNPNASARRRRPAAGRRSTNAKKLAMEVHTDVESRRKRHGQFGWHAHEAGEESWRHVGAPVVGVPQAA
ncbi:uncharacterized protein LAESUDRAFT_725386 [Laetiporus sulphureus 93-53]|uniref:Uncharacterized protein n=1 Tax=Laetiporus sulphureus 93-53 TaxID=1314785 RepID=A0A165EH44_9APHY|nr:uncharacterized protein LAESUDRAFT_725386 [Laetiporus sulphureus 93-53]KZT07042.1 hypothetical protein LAESUDRAFT_725386 [Laetiporus sulphureus 93-53]